MPTLINTVKNPITAEKSGHSTIIRVTTLGLEYGDSYRNLLTVNDDSLLDLSNRIDDVEYDISEEVDNRIDYVDGQIESLENSLLIPTSTLTTRINDIIEEEITNGVSSSIINTKAINAVDTNFSLSILSNNLESQFGENASNINTKLATYATNNDVGAIAQVALDVDGRITGWTAVNSSASGSAFKINADTFSLTDGTNTHTPLAIDTATGLTQFNGIVSFNNTNMDSYDNSNISVIDSQDVVDEINNSNTTTINGGRITTGTITANKINTTGLIAENISANEIVGKTIEGGEIIGANITGVTIRASYLDLDGELEVLTDFYLCVGGDTTGVPATAISEGRYRTYSSADIDAVLSTSYSNLYRIPTLSTVRETTFSSYIGAGTTKYGNIRSYDTANAGHNAKARKLRPSIVCSVDTLIIDSAISTPYSAIGDREFSVTASDYYTLYVGGQSCTISLYNGAYRDFGIDDSNRWYNYDSGDMIVNGSNLGGLYPIYVSVSNEDSIPSRTDSTSKYFTFNGCSFRIDLYASNPSGATSAKVYLLAGSYTLSSNLNDDYLFKIYCNRHASGNDVSQVTANAKLSSSISINNLA